MQIHADKRAAILKFDIGKTADRKRAIFRRITARRASSRVALHAQLFDTVNVNNTLTLEGNFRFVLDKSDLKSASDKKFVRKATVALKNKICEQNTTPCCERLVISAHS